MRYSTAKVERDMFALIKDLRERELEPAVIRLTFVDDKPVVSAPEVRFGGTLPLLHVMRRVSSRMQWRMRSAHPWLTAFQWNELVPYTLEDLCRRLSRRFENGLCWDNIGEWHIDHIRPLASFSIESTDSESFRQAWALNNLQPLWARDNLSKGARW